MNSVLRLVIGLSLALASHCRAMDVLRLPWIFSDKPQLTADFNFSPPTKSNKSVTHVELALGGRFSQFGLPRGAARAPELSMRCEFVSPESLSTRVATLDAKVSLGQVLEESSLDFKASRFSSSSRLVFKTEFAVDVAPGDYNVVVTIEDKELSLYSRRTLHVIVPELSNSKPALSDLKFCLGVGQALDKAGHIQRVLDPNPWRQVGGDSGWDLIVAYQGLGAFANARLLRRVSIFPLRGRLQAGKPLWQEQGPAPARKKSQVYLTKVGPKVLNTLKRGIYILKIEMWQPGQEAKEVSSSKTFEVL